MLHEAYSDCWPNTNTFCRRCSTATSHPLSFHNTSRIPSHSSAPVLPALVCGWTSRLQKSEHTTVVWYITISETATVQIGNFAFQVAKRHPRVLSFSILPALISLPRKYFVQRKVYRPPYAIYALELSPSTSLLTFRFLSQRNQLANSSTALLTLT